MRRHIQILFAVTLLVAVVVSFAARIGVLVYEGYRDVDAVLAAERLKTRIIELTSALARERGWGMVWLGIPQSSRSQVITDLMETRTEVDSKWYRLKEQFQQPAPIQNSSELFEFSIGKLDATWSRFLSARHALQDSWGSAPNKYYQEWFDEATNLISAARDVWRAIEAPGARELATTGRYQRIRDAAWVLSEYAGRERGLFSYFVSASQPLPHEQYERLQLIRAVIDHHQAELSSAVQGDGLPDSVKMSLTYMRSHYYDNFNPVRERVYDSIGNGAYPIDGISWIRYATEAIDSMVGVSESVNRAMQGRLYVVVARSQRDLIVTIFLLVAVCVAAAFIFSRVRSVVAELFDQKRMAEITLGSIGDGVIATDAEAQIDYLNTAAEKMTGWRSNDAHGKPFAQIFPLVNRYTLEPGKDVVSTCIESGQITPGTNDSMLVRRDGTEVPVFHSTAPITDPDGGVAGTVTVFYDLLNNWSEQHLLSYHASHDSLTGLANRLEFERCLHAVTSRPSESDEQYAMCYIDIDQFKVINDTCGHQAGDLLIKELVEVLKARVRVGDLFARLGGDEFGVLLQGCGSQEAIEVAESLRQSAEDFRFRYDGKLFSVGLSIGVIPVVHRNQSPAQLLSLADTACFTAKEKGRNQIHVYQPDDPEISKHHSDMMWMSRVQTALEKDGFELYCQPIVQVEDSKLFAVEILLRMKEHDGVVASPGVFIPAAERFGLMGAVDRWVIENTFKALAVNDLLGDRGAELAVCINLSGSSLSSPTVAEFILRQFEHYGIDPHRICFEVTETAAIANFKTAYTLLSALRGQGCKVSLDDFGTGLSSFAYLRDLPIDFIKMGGGFVRDMLSDQRHEAMVQATHAIAVAMEVPMIAESVENDEIIYQLRTMGVEYMQGYGIARPKPLKRYLTQEVVGGLVSFSREVCGLPS